MINNKYGSTASTAVWEKAAQIRKFKFEQQRKASATQAYMTLFLAAALTAAIVYNVIAGL